MTTPVSGNINTNYIPTSFLDANGEVKADKRDLAATISAGVQARVEQMPEAEKKAFLSLVQGGAIDLTPSSNGTPTDVDASINRLADAMDKIFALASLGGSMIDLLARVMVEQAAAQRKNALEERLAARQTAQSELMSQAAEMKDAAKKMQDGAIAALVLSVVMSAVSIGASVASLKGSIGAGKQLKQIHTDEIKAQNTPQPGPKTQAETMAFDKSEASRVWQRDLQLKEVDIKNTQAGTIGTIGQTVNQLGQGAANFASTESQALSKLADAAGSIDAAQAQEAEALADTRKEMQQSLEDMIKSIINFLKELKDAKAEMARAFTKV